MQGVLSLICVAEDHRNPKYPRFTPFSLICEAFGFWLGYLPTRQQKPFRAVFLSVLYRSCNNIRSCSKFFSLTFNELRKNKKNKSVFIWSVQKIVVSLQTQMNEKRGLQEVFEVLNVCCCCNSKQTHII